MNQVPYDAREGAERFRMQFPHISGGYAVIDWAFGALVVVGYEDDALAVAAALNAATNPAVEEAELVAALSEVDPPHEWRVMEHLTHLVRRQLAQTETPPEVDMSYLDRVAGPDAASIRAAVETAVHPNSLESGINALSLYIPESPNDTLKAVPDEQKWRVSLILAHILRGDMGDGIMDVR